MTWKIKITSAILWRKSLCRELWMIQKHLLYVAVLLCDFSCINDVIASTMTTVALTLKKYNFVWKQSYNVVIAAYACTGPDVG